MMGKGRKQHGKSRCDNNNDDSDSAGGHSHKHMKLNQWDAAAMEAAIDEYNKLCQDHGSANVSIKLVAVKHGIPPTTFWKRYISVKVRHSLNLRLCVILNVN